MLIIIAAILVAPIIAVIYAGISDAVHEAQWRKDCGIY